MWSSPAVFGNSVSIGVASFGTCPDVQGRLLKLNRVTGALQNTFNVVPNGCIGGGVWSSPTIDAAAGTIYFTSGNQDTCPTSDGAGPHRHVTVITERLAAAFALAVDAGELDTAPEAALAAAHLIGPLVYRTALQAAAVPDSLLAAVIDSVAHWRAPDPARSRPASAPGQRAGSNQEPNPVAQA